MDTGRRAAERSPTQSSDRPAKKHKPMLSCAECRRLKMKCDRELPCANCVRRNCSQLCPNETQAPKTKKIHADLLPQELKDKIDHLESLLEAARSIANMPPHKPSWEESSRTRYQCSISPAPSVRGKSSSTSSRAEEITHSPDVIVLDTTGLMIPTNLPETPSHAVLAPSRQGHSLDAPRRQYALWSPDRTEHAGKRTGPAAATGLMEHQPPSFLRSSNGLSAPGSVQIIQSDGSQHPLGDGVSNEMGQPSYGTLVLNSSGTSKYVGPTAGSQWLHDQEAIDGNPTPAGSRRPSPTPLRTLTGRQDVTTSRSENSRGKLPLTHSQFPFARVVPATTMQELIDRLPPVDEAKVLVDAYCRHFTWNYNIVSRPAIDLVFNNVYSTPQRWQFETTLREVHPHSLALLFVILALGTLLNLEVPPNDPSAEEFYLLAQSCLAKGDFLRVNTIASVQALHIMAQFTLATESGATGDSAWPLWGLAMRITQAMGLHRDGARWNLQSAIVEERRRVFWEMQAADVFQSNCFSRPNSMCQGHFDTLFPSDEDAIGIDQPVDVTQAGFNIQKYRLAVLSKEVLDEALRAEPSPYQTILIMWHKICDFEQTLPFRLRCRPAMKAMLSRYADEAAAHAASPSVTRSNLKLTFQQHTLALNTCETVLFLQRPYFARALHDNPEDPCKSTYSQSFLAVLERCSMILRICDSVHTMYPSISLRHWFFWYHAFSAGVCFSTVAMLSPRNVLFGYILSELDKAISIFKTAANDAKQQRITKNLHWLVKLRKQAMDGYKASMAAEPESLLTHRSPITDNPDVTDHLSMLGWRTRLISRASPNEKVATTIASKSDAESLQALLFPSPAVANDTGQREGGDASDLEWQSSADWLQQFWDAPLGQPFAPGSGDSLLGHVSMIGRESGFPWPMAVGELELEQLLGLPSGLSSRDEPNEPTMRSLHARASQWNDQM